MPGNAGSVRFSLREPFEREVETVCRALVSRGLRVAGQLDVSRRVKRSLGIVLPPCRIVFVLPHPSTPVSSGTHPWAASFLPLHVVISGNGAQTEIQVQNRIQGAPAEAPAPVLETQTEMRRAIEAIAMRPSMVV